MNITAKQVIAILLIVLGVLTASTAQLTDLFGADAAKYVISAAGILNSILAGVLGIFTTQASAVRDVQAMPGVEKITVNAQANSTLAGLAVGEADQKVEAKPGAEAAVARAAQS